MTDDISEFQRVFAAHDLGFSDALQVMRSHFQQAMSSNDNRAIYSHDGQDALVLAFDRKESFAGLEVGRGLRDDDLARLLAAVKAPRPQHVMTTVIFSNVPTVGRWRYRDCFQIFPMPPEAPRPPHAFGGVHPLMLEVGYDGSENDHVDEYRGAVATRDVNRLLSGVLRGTEDRLGHFVRMDWVVLPEADAAGIEHRQSHFGQLGYFLGGERTL